MTQNYTKPVSLSGPAFTFIHVLISRDPSIRFILPLERSPYAKRKYVRHTPVKQVMRELLSAYGLLQHVRSATHRHRHTLDLLITRDDQVVNVLPIDPPILSDHSFVVATVGCVPFASRSTSACQMRNWREVDVDEMAADLLRSDLIVSPPDDLDSMIDSYNTSYTTLRALVDKHVPLWTKRSQERRSARWFDRKCRESKRLTRKLERRYRRVRTADAQAAWRQKFDTQRHLFQSKLTAFWLSTVESCQQNPRVLWRIVNAMLHPPRQHDTLSAADFASFFSEAKWPIYGLPQHLRNHRSLTHGRRHLSVSFSQRLLKRSLVSSTRCPPSLVHWTLFIRGS